MRGWSADGRVGATFRWLRLFSPFSDFGRQHLKRNAASARVHFASLFRVLLKVELECVVTALIVLCQNRANCLSLEQSNVKVQCRDAGRALPRVLTVRWKRLSKHPHSLWFECLNTHTHTHHTGLSNHLTSRLCLRSLPFHLPRQQHHNTSCHSFIHFFYTVIPPNVNCWLCSYTHINFHQADKLSFHPWGHLLHF